MKRPYQITGVACILFSAYMISESLDLSFYTVMGPGPGFFPLLVSVLMGFIGVAIFYQATFQQTDPMPDDFYASRAGYLRMGAITLALAGLVALMNLLGFRVAMLAFLLFLLSTLGRQNLLTTAVIAVIGSFGIYHLFVNFLSIPLPIGIFGL